MYRRSETKRGPERSYRMSERKATRDSQRHPLPSPLLAIVSVQRTPLFFSPTLDLHAQRLNIGPIMSLAVHWPPAHHGRAHPPVASSPDAPS
jgi:hypothetical protein